MFCKNVFELVERLNRKQDKYLFINVLKKSLKMFYYMKKTNLHIFTLHILYTFEGNIRKFSITKKKKRKNLIVVNKKSI